jgi:hypothetical protein
MVSLGRIATEGDEGYMARIGIDRQRVLQTMSTFDDREKQFEAKFQHDQELQFKVTVRRNRLLGEWAGTLMGLEGEDLKNYAKEVVQSDFDKPGDEDVFEKVKADLKAKSIAASDHQIRKNMDDLLMEAKKQIMTE